MCTPPPTVSKLISPPPPPLFDSPADRSSLCSGIKSTMSLSNFPLVFSFLFFFRIGVLCAYAANQNLSSQVKNIRRYVNSNMRDLHTFANDTPMVREPPCRWCTSCEMLPRPCALFAHTFIYKNTVELKLIFTRFCWHLQAAKICFCL